MDVNVHITNVRTGGNEMGVNLTSGRIEEMGGCKCTYNKCKDRGNEVGVNVTARGQREMGWL